MRFLLPMGHFRLKLDRQSMMRLHAAGVPLIAIVTIGTFASVASGGQGSSEMTRFQEEAARSIRDITLQLILLAVGVFSLAGAYLVKRDSSTAALSSKASLKWAFISLAASVLAGYFVYGSLIAQLSAHAFDPYFWSLRVLAMAQALLFFVGGVLFMVFVYRNVR